MKKGLFLLLALCLTAALAFAALNNASSDKARAPADDQKAQKPDAAAEGQRSKKAKDMTVQELVDGITGVLDKTEEVMDYVPGFREEKDSAGKAFYTYQGSRLENIPKEKLVSLYNMVRQTRTRLNAERITAQLDSIRDAQRAAEIANQASRTVTPPKPPPQVPKTPPAPPPTRR